MLSSTPFQQPPRENLFPTFFQTIFHPTICLIQKQSATIKVKLDGSQIHTKMLDVLKNGSSTDIYAVHNQASHLLLMLLPTQSQHFSLCLNKDDKVRYISPAIRNSYVLLLQRGEKFDLVNVDLEGNYRLNCPLRDHYPTCAMLNYHEVIIVRRSKCVIQIVDVGTKIERRIQIMCPGLTNALCVGIIPFKESNRFCLHFWHRGIILVYYNYRQYAQIKQQEVYWTNKDPENEKIQFNPGFQLIKKVDESSKICFVNPNQSVSEEITFTIAEVIGKDVIKVCTIKTAQSLRDIGACNCITFPIFAIEALSKDKYLIHTDAKCDGFKECLSIDTSLGKKVAILNIEQNNIKYQSGKRMSLLKLFQPKQNGSWFGASYRYQNSQGKGFLSSAKETNNVRYFMGDDHTSVIKLQTPPLSSNPKLLKKNLVEVELTSKRYFCDKEIYMHLLHAFYKNLDDQLLEDAVCLLTE